MDLILSWVCYIYCGGHFNIHQYYHKIFRRLEEGRIVSICPIVVKCELSLSSTAIRVTAKFQSNMFKLTISRIRYVIRTHDRTSYRIWSWPQHLLTLSEINQTGIMFVAWIGKLIPGLRSTVPWILSKVLYFFYESCCSRVRHPPQPGCWQGSLTWHMNHFEQSDWPKWSNFINIVIENL